jgi:eukaryotic-like serine/threonine-protein kinase
VIPSRLFMNVHVTSSLQPGDRLDHYRIETLAAVSGMASIYRAINVKNGAHVALKIPHFEAESDPVFFDPFKREEEIGRRVNHHGVMKVFDDGERSRVYMVMEWLEGRRNIKGRPYWSRVWVLASTPTERNAHNG